MARQCVSPGEDRNHSVYRFTEQIYKVIQWNRVVAHLGPGPVENRNHYDEKLDSSVSRTYRMILEKALCNPWDWFCTFTISEDKFDRSDLITWRDSFTQWMRDQRKKGFPIKYLVVPEQHGDGSWHAHGFLAGLPESELISFRQMDKDGYRTAQGRRLPKKLRYSEYMNWPAYMNKFGFCSLGKIKNPIAAGFYITKYITKDNDRMVKEVGLHSYYSNKGLNVAEKHVDFFGRDADIDRLLVNKYEFCSTGMTHVRDGCDWSFCQNYVDFASLDPLEIADYGEEKTEAETEADEYFEFEQLVISGGCNFG